MTITTTGGNLTWTDNTGTHNAWVQFPALQLQPQPMYTVGQVPQQAPNPPLMPQAFDANRPCFAMNATAIKDLWLTKNGEGWIVHWSLDLDWQVIAKRLIELHWLEWYSDAMNTTYYRLV
jgi:hypothetical protein